MIGSMLHLGVKDRIQHQGWGMVFSNPDILLLLLALDFFFKESGVYIVYPLLQIRNSYPLLQRVACFSKPQKVQDWPIGNIGD